MRYNLLAALVAALLLVACVDYQQMALDHLAEGGYQDVELGRKDKAKKTWTVAATKEGIPCAGTLNATSMPGSSAVDFSDTIVCKEPRDPNAPDDSDPFAALRKGCEGGDLAVCLRLGEGLVAGEPGPRDLPAARTTFSKVCDAGGLKGCVELGFLHMKGLGGEQSEPEAERLYTKACEGGEISGCGRLGKLRYINRKYKEAFPIFEKACDDGDLPSCTGLAELYREGHGVKKADVKKARELFELACAAGEMSACSNVGVMYLDGVGGSRSIDRAKEALEKACKAEITVACMHLRKLK